MTVQLSVAVRNARLDAIETTIGTAAILKIRSGAQPANCAAADSGTVLASMTLDSDWMSAASNGTKSKSGTWSDSTADATGTAAHYRLYDASGTAAGAQGSVTTSGGGGDLELDSVAITSGQAVTITSWAFIDGNG